MQRNRFLLAWVILLISAAPIFACDGGGPSDPVTGLIVYQNGQGGTSVPSSPETDQNNVVKGWNSAGTRADYIFLFTGSTVGFEGIIQGGTTAPSDWEEGRARGEKGYKVAEAPAPSWTISGNGRGDFRDGFTIPTPSGFTYKMFEKNADCMIAAGTPAVKAVWKLSYDQNSALNIIAAYLGRLQNTGDIRYQLLQQEIPGFSISNLNFIKDNTQYHNTDVLSYNNYVIDYDERNPDILRQGLCEALPFSEGSVVNLDFTEREFAYSAREYNATLGRYEDVTKTFYKNLPLRKVTLVKCGYVAMQEWYQTGQYSTHYYVYPPYGTSQGSQVLTGSRFTEARLSYTFTTPCFPSYWTFDLHSGLETCKDCVYTWIEVTKYLKDSGTVVSGLNAPETEFYSRTDSADDIAIGGVFVRGYYQNGGSSAGRNTTIYVSVLDREPPAKFTWVNPANPTQEDFAVPLAAKSGEKPTTAGNKLRIRVYDDNPMIGAAPGTFNTLNRTTVSGLNYRFAGAGNAGAILSSYYNDYMQKTSAGFASSLKPRLVYNVCIPTYLGMKLRSDKDPGAYPVFFDRMVIPAQRFVWKEISPNSATVVARQLYSKNGTKVSNPGGLIDSDKWDGYSSYDVEFTMGEFTRMGYHFADNSEAFDLPMGIFEDFSAPPPPDGIQFTGAAESRTLKFAEWSPKSLKLFAVGSDGLNEVPDAASLNAIKALKYSGVELSGANADNVGTWVESGVSAKPPVLDGAVLKGGRLSNGPQGKWGKYAYVSSVVDEGRPNIALEILNTKNNRRIYYGNFRSGAGQSDKYWEAFGRAESSSAWVDAANESNDAEKGYASDDTENVATWTFRYGVTSNHQAAMGFEGPIDWLMSFESALEKNNFRPALFSLPENHYTSRFLAGNAISQSNYWNGKTTYNNNMMAYISSARTRLVFRYWTWDNINPFFLSHSSPNGMEVKASKKDANDKSTAAVVLVDKPVFEAAGEVDDANYWPDYIFNNPGGAGTDNPDGTPANSNSECSLSLTAKDERGNSRHLKLFFTILGTDQEVIRTLEDRRERR